MILPVGPFQDRCKNQIKCLRKPLVSSLSVCSSSPSTLPSSLEHFVTHFYYLGEMVLSINAHRGQAGMEMIEIGGVGGGHGAHLSPT